VQGSKEKILKRFKKVDTSTETRYPAFNWNDSGSNM
jgi:hypothetical protein